MSKQFLDKDGLDIVAEQINLKPSTFTGTTSEWEAVSDKSKYEIVNLTDDVTDTTEVVRNPDWTRAIVISTSDILSGYTFLNDGIVIMPYVIPSSTATVQATITINNIPICKPYYNSTNQRPLSIVCPVAKGDIIKSDIAIVANDAVYFVPYKTSIIDNRIPLNYSTTEQFTGKYWIDGKKIYRKVLTGTTSSQGNTFPSNTNSVNIPIGALTETIIDYKVNVNKTDTGISLKDGEVLTNVEFVAAWSRNNSHPTSPNTIAVSVGTGLTSSPIVCVVEYTKTTD